MAFRKHEQQSRNAGRRKRRKLPALLLVLMLALAGCFGWMHLSARITHLRYAQLYLPDLPAAFDGSSLVFVSDINAMSEADAEHCARAVMSLDSLQPDMLLLGGDYSAPGPVDALNGAKTGNGGHALRFIEEISGFSAPLGKFAVAGEGDDASALSTACDAAGIRLLRDACAKVERGGSELIIAGLSDSSLKETPYEEIGGYFSGNECVIAVSHNPSSYVGVRVAEARGGGAWADLVLCGHTLGGQVNLFGRTLRTMSEEEARFIGGWYNIDDLPLLVSEGLGCRDIKLRLGSSSEIWHITLRRPVHAG